MPAITINAINRAGLRIVMLFAVISAGALMLRIRFIPLDVEPVPWLRVWGPYYLRIFVEDRRKDATKYLDKWAVAVYHAIDAYNRAILAICNDIAKEEGIDSVDLLPLVFHFGALLITCRVMGMLLWVFHDLVQVVSAILHTLFLLAASTICALFRLA